MNDDMMKAIHELLSSLFSTGSGKEQLLRFDAWVSKQAIDPVAAKRSHDLFAARAEKQATSGRKGGLAIKKKQDTTDIIREVLSELIQTVPSKKNKKDKKGRTYKAPIFVQANDLTQKLNCSSCHEKIGRGYAFVWQRNGKYDNFHMDCIPEDNRSLFEGVKDYQVMIATNPCLADQSGSLDQDQEGEIYDRVDRPMIRSSQRDQRVAAEQSISESKGFTYQPDLTPETIGCLGSTLPTPVPKSNLPSKATEGTFPILN
jgi:hypothetical protein